MTATSQPPATAPARWPERVLLEDEQTRIDHFTAPKRSRTLVIVFDPLLYLAQRPHFGQDFLRKLGVDIVAVRKKGENFYQPLSRAAFVEAVGPLLARYTRVVAYGSSLGAYAALYFCRDLDCDVIASSPRVSVHPVYGVRTWQRTTPFEHERFSPAQPARCRPIVIYDPKEPMDRRFTEQEILPQFPHAQVLRVPYSGHPSNHFLSEIGFIAPFARAVIAGTPPPQPDRAGKASSPSYHAALAVHCLHRRKPRWARDLAARALTRHPGDLSVVRTLALAEIELGDIDAAVPRLQRVIDRFPDDAAALAGLRRADRLRGRAGKAETAGRAWSGAIARALRAIRRPGSR